MSKGKLFFGVAVLALMGGAVLVRSGVWTTESSTAAPARQRGPGQQRVVPVEIGKAVRQAVPVRVDSLGTVTPIASVAIKSRLETTIVDVHFRDGAHVDKGDLLFTLDCRQIEADMKRVQAIIDGAEASLKQAQRDVDRYTELVGRNATPIVTLNNAQTAVNVSRATAESNRAQLENLKVQRGFCSIRAPITGRISMANLKIGNFVRPADSTPLATIIQLSPVYVSFTVPQKELPALREALKASTASVEALIPGDAKRARGDVSMIENTVDSSTGMAMVRATMPNDDELLWPGTLVTAQMTLRTEQAVVVSSNAVQVSQTGNFVFLVDRGAAKVQPVTVERQFGELSVIAAGLKGGETVVTDGQLLLSNGTRVAPRGAKPAGPPKSRAGS
jgi:multidrug efflux system membrane fusion protein